MFQRLCEILLGPAHPLMGGKPRSSHWPAVRAAHLLRESSCVACGGKEHLQVHHVHPYHLRAELELDPDNLITLCEHPGRNCHLWFGHLLSWSSWNAEVRADAERFGWKVRTRPKP